MDNSNDSDDEIAIDPIRVPNIPIPRPVARIADWVPRGWRPGNGRRVTSRAWLLVAVVAVIVTGALKLAGVIWTSAGPAWATELGPGVTVTAPGPVTPGHDSPGAAVTGLIAALSSKDLATSCGYIFVERAVQCGASGHDSRKELPYGVSFKIGYVATSGTRALAGFTGRLCSPGATPECMTNTDPAAVFSTGNTFAALWSQATGQNSAGFSSYRLLPCVEVGGKWYVGPGPA